MPVLPQEIRDAINKGLDAPQLSEVITFFFQEAGGPREVGKMLWQEYVAANKGSQTRQRILDMVLLILQKDEENKAGLDIDSMSLEDIQNEFNSQLQRLGVDSGTQGTKQQGVDPNAPAGGNAAVDPSIASGAASGTSPDAGRRPEFEEVDGGAGI